MAARSAGSESTKPRGRRGEMSAEFFAMSLKLPLPSDEAGEMSDFPNRNVHERQGAGACCPLATPVAQVRHRATCRLADSRIRDLKSTCYSHQSQEGGEYMTDFVTVLTRGVETFGRNPSRRIMRRS